MDTYNVITFVIRFNRFSVVRAMLRHAQWNPEKYRWDHVVAKCSNTLTGTGKYGKKKNRDSEMHYIFLTKGVFQLCKQVLQIILWLFIRLSWEQTLVVMKSLKVTLFFTGLHVAYINFVVIQDLCMIVCVWGKKVIAFLWLVA